MKRSPLMFLALVFSLNQPAWSQPMRPTEAAPQDAGVPIDQVSDKAKKNLAAVVAVIKPIEAAHRCNIEILDALKTAPPSTAQFGEDYKNVLKDGLFRRPYYIGFGDKPNFGGKQPDANAVCDNDVWVQIRRLDPQGQDWPGKTINGQRGMLRVFDKLYFDLDQKAEAVSVNARRILKVGAVLGVATLDEMEDGASVTVRKGSSYETTNVGETRSTLLDTPIKPELAAAASEALFAPTNPSRDNSVIAAGPLLRDYYTSILDLREAVLAFGGDTVHGYPELKSLVTVRAVRGQSDLGNIGMDKIVEELAKAKGQSWKDPAVMNDPSALGRLDPRLRNRVAIYHRQVNELLRKLQTLPVEAKPVKPGIPTQDVALKVSKDGQQKLLNKDVFGKDKEPGIMEKLLGPMGAPGGLVGPPVAGPVPPWAPGAQPGDEVKKEPPVGPEKTKGELEKAASEKAQAQKEDEEKALAAKFRSDQGAVPANIGSLTVAAGEQPKRGFLGRAWDKTKSVGGKIIDPFGFISPKNAVFGKSGCGGPGDLGKSIAKKEDKEKEKAMDAAAKNSKARAGLEKERETKTAAIDVKCKADVKAIEAELVDPDLPEDQTKADKATRIAAKVQECKELRDKALEPLSDKAEKNKILSKEDEAAALKAKYKEIDATTAAEFGKRIMGAASDNLRKEYKTPGNARRLALEEATGYKGKFFRPQRVDAYFDRNWDPAFNPLSNVATCREALGFKEGAAPEPSKSGATAPRYKSPNPENVDNLCGVRKGLIAFMNEYKANAPKTSTPPASAEDGGL